MRFTAATVTALLATSVAAAPLLSILGLGSDSKPVVDTSVTVSAKITAPKIVSALKDIGKKATLSQTCLGDSGLLNGVTNNLGTDVPKVSR